MEPRIREWSLNFIIVVTLFIGIKMDQHFFSFVAVSMAACRLFWSPIEDALTRVIQWADKNETVEAPLQTRILVDAVLFVAFIYDPDRVFNLIIDDINVALKFYSPPPAPVPGDVSENESLPDRPKRATTQLCLVDSRAGPEKAKPILVRLRRPAELVCGDADRRNVGNILKAIHERLVEAEASWIAVADSSRPSRHTGDVGCHKSINEILTVIYNQLAGGEAKPIPGYPVPKRRRRPSRRDRDDTDYKALYDILKIIHDWLEEVAKIKPAPESPFYLVRYCSSWLAKCKKLNSALATAT